MIYEDDQVTPRLTISAFRALVHQKKVDVIVNCSATTGQAIGGLADQAEIPFISLSSDKKLTANHGYSRIFWATPEAIARRIAVEANHRGLKKAAILTSFWPDWPLCETSSGGGY